MSCSKLSTDLEYVLLSSRRRAKNSKILKKVIAEYIQNLLQSINVPMKEALEKEKGNGIICS